MTVPAGSPDSLPTPRLCNRCKEAEATFDLRNAETVCSSCFANFVSTKAIKRLEVLQRETRPTSSRLASAPQRHLVALSCGPSSTALLHILHESLRRQQGQEHGQGQEQRKGRGKGQRRPHFELVVVYVVFDAAVVEDGSADNNGGSTEEQEFLDRYRARFPELEIQAVDLSSIVGSSGVDWSALPQTSTSSPPPSSQQQQQLDQQPPATTTTRRQQQQRRRRQQLADLFARLPSATSRADVRRLLTRHALLAAAAENRCDVVLLGHSTTALAELTLGEAAKGRGFSLPWVVNDGASFPVPVPVLSGRDGDGNGSEGGAVEQVATSSNSSNGGSAGMTTITKTIALYYPLRELFRKELLSYASTTTPPLTGLLATNNNSHLPKDNNGAVVSHKDLSIDDVMARYFGEVEASYPSVVANVVRTTGKLSRAAGGEEENESEDGGTAKCGLCGIALDKSGDERWRGEIGENSDELLERTKNLCYGCERSMRA